MMDYLVLTGCGLTRSDAAKVLPPVLLVCQRGCKRSADPLQYVPAICQTSQKSILMQKYSKLQLHPGFLHVVNQEPSVVSTISWESREIPHSEKDQLCISDFIQVAFRITPAQSIKKDGEIDAWESIICRLCWEAIHPVVPIDFE